MASFDVFTPPEVAAKMRSYLPERVGLLLEPSVGTGDLLRVMDGAYERADVVDINQQYLLRIPESPAIVKTCGDFLSMPMETRYDAILMNPPYLRFQDMPQDMRLRVRGVSHVLRKGNIDLYVAFLVKCIGLLKDAGTLVAVVPSTWMYNKSATLFREWMFSERLVSAIHDYGSKKVFAGADVYCCILVVNRLPKTGYLLNDVHMSFEQSTEMPSQCLGDVCDIQNGVATLCDGVFIHDAPLFDEPCWKPLLKVSKRKTRYIVYPYGEDGNVLAENVFRQTNPQTYAYLEGNRNTLAARDKGHKTYEAWYAFGRKQGIRIPAGQQSVYVSTLSSPELPTFCEATALFYSGIRVTPRDIACDLVQKSIHEHRAGITAACSKRSSNWINVTTTSLRKVPVHQ